jgi:HAD superfamily hydrolase (TIGR01509 family)
MTGSLAQGVVFDCDGVIADTTPCWDHTFAHVAAGRGLALTPSQAAQLHGSAVPTAAAVLSRWAGDEDIAGLTQELADELFASVERADLAAIDGLVELAQALHGSLPMAVASNAPRRVLLSVLERLGVTSYFRVVVSADDVESPKPAPDAYLEACASLEAEPSECFAIEDSEVGAKSAHAAGMSVIRVMAHPGTFSPRQDRAVLSVTSLIDPRVASLLLGLTIPGKDTVRTARAAQ